MAQKTIIEWDFDTNNYFETWQESHDFVMGWQRNMYQTGFKQIYPAKGMSFHLPSFFPTFNGHWQSKSNSLISRQKLELSEFYNFEDEYIIDNAMTNQQELLDKLRIEAEIYYEKREPASTYYLPWDTYITAKPCIRIKFEEVADWYSYEINESDEGYSFDEAQNTQRFNGKIAIDLRSNVFEDSPNSVKIQFLHEVPVNYDGFSKFVVKNIKIIAYTGDPDGISGVKPPTPPPAP